METEENATAPSRAVGRWAGAVTAFVLFVSGIGIGWLFTDAPDEVTEITAAPQELETVLDMPETTTTILEGVNTDPLIEYDAVEPVADVAAALLPSVVQIEVGNGFGSGVGTGVIFDESGLILTAQHVVEGFTQVVVRLSTGDKVGRCCVGRRLSE